MNWLLELFQNSVFQTIISGVFVFILSQYFLKFILEPLQEYQKVIAKIDNKLKFYSSTIVNPPFPIPKQLSENYLIAKKELRELSSELQASYRCTVLYFHKKTKKRISIAVEDLIWLSNATGYRDETGNINVPIMANDKIENIRKNLNIPEL